MKRWEEHARLVERVLKLKNRKLERGGLSIREQAKYDKLMERIRYISMKDCEEVDVVMKKIGECNGK